MPAPHPILVVEDDAHIRDAVRELLEDAGYSVVVAGNGREALDYLEKSGRDPCLVLLDMMMPVMSGDQFLEILDEDDRLVTLPVVVLSAYNKAEKEAVRAYLKKPAPGPVILDLVRLYCGGECQ